MIHAHSLGRAANYYGKRTALALGAARPSFLELHDRVAAIAAALSTHGFRAGDRLAMLLPNEPDYLELVYACAWLGVIAVPVNTRLSITEIDHLSELEKYDLSSLERLAYGGSPMAPELIHRTREVLPNLKLIQG